MICKLLVETKPYLFFVVLNPRVTALTVNCEAPLFSEFRHEMRKKNIRIITQHYKLKYCQKLPYQSSKKFKFLIHHCHPFYDLRSFLGSTKIILMLKILYQFFVLIEEEIRNNFCYCEKFRFCTIYEIESVNIGLC